MSLNPSPAFRAGKIIVALLVVIASAVSHVPSARAQFQTDPTCTQDLGPWQLMAPAPFNHHEGAVGVINGKLYIISGFATPPPITPSNRIDVYDLATNTWETVANPRGPAPYSWSHIQGAVDGQYIWVAGGFVGISGGPAIAEVWRYDTVNDTWTAFPNMPAPRASGALVIQGRNLHYISGLGPDRQTDHPDHWVMNLDNPIGWTAAAPIPRARNHFQAVELHGLIYAIGGLTGHDGPHIDTNWVDVYNPATDTWQALANLDVRRSHSESSTFVLNERIITMGGRSWDLPNPIDRVSQYNPQTDTWTNLRPLPVPLYVPTGVVVGNYVVVTVGGTNWNAPQSNTWIAEIITDCVVGAPPAPAISIIKDADQTITSGSSANFSISVTNTGNVALTGVTVTDPATPACAANIGALAVAAVHNYTCAAANVTASFTNTATVTGTHNATTVTASDSATVTVTTAAMVVTKAPDQVLDPGDTANFIITVENTGIDPLTNITVTNNAACSVGATFTGGDVNADTVLDPGEIWSYTCFVDNVAASFITRATVTATIPGGGTITASDTASVTVNGTPPVAPPANPAPNQQIISPNFIVSASGALANGAAGQAGDRILWRIDVTNTGNAPSSIGLNALLDGSLNINGVTIDRGTFALNGNAVRVDLAGLGAGDMFSIIIDTTLISQPAGGVVQLRATLNNGEAVNALVRVLPPVTRLPATGGSRRVEDRLALLVALSSGLIILGAAVTLLRRPARATGR